MYHLLKSHSNPFHAGSTRGVEVEACFGPARRFYQVPSEEVSPFLTKGNQ